MHRLSGSPSASVEFFPCPPERLASAANAGAVVSLVPKKLARFGATPFAIQFRRLRRVRRALAHARARLVHWSGRLGLLVLHRGQVGCLRGGARGAPGGLQ
eukprot:4072389-Pyramimonas_sp.AAC.1